MLYFLLVHKMKICNKYTGIIFCFKTQLILYWMAQFAGGGCPLWKYHTLKSVTHHTVTYLLNVPHPTPTHSHLDSYLCTFLLLTYLEYKYLVMFNVSEVNIWVCSIFLGWYYMYIECFLYDILIMYILWSFLNFVNSYDANIVVHCIFLLHKFFYYKIVC